VHATKVIQKWARGMLGRKKMKKLRLRHKDEIEREYDFIESSLKVLRQPELQPKKLPKRQAAAEEAK